MIKRMWLNHLIIIQQLHYLTKACSHECFQPKSSKRKGSSGRETAMIFPTTRTQSSWATLKCKSANNYVPLFRNSFANKGSTSFNDSLELDYERDFSGCVSSSLNVFEQMLAKENKGDSSLATKSKAMYSLTFTYDFEYENDTVFFAYSFPYTTSQNSELIQDIEKRCEHKNIFKKDILWSTLGGRPWYMLTITENIDSYMTSIEEKKYFAYTKADLVDSYDYKSMIILTLTNCLF